MKIQEATVSLQSRHALQRAYQRQESVRFWLGDTRPRFADEQGADPVQISGQARRLLERASQEAAASGEADTNTPALDPQVELIRRVLEALTGKEIRVAAFASKPTANASPQSASPPATATPPRQGWGLEYDLEHTITEQESLQFAASGQVLTTDGRSMAFRLDLAMERQQVSTAAFHLRAGDALLVDPLVITLDGGTTSFDDLRFAFDLNGDGVQEAMPFVAAGSGFLAWDRNQDGMINNGLELFGPTTGNGFNELAALDSDGNGWLDENDPHFAELSLWMRDAAGKETIQSLADHQIGAILLARVATPFCLQQGETSTGQLRESSVALLENGKAGTVQELDLAV